MTRSSESRNGEARLDIRGPVAAGLLVIALFVGAGAGLSATVPVDKGASLAGTIIVETKAKPVQHVRGGQVGRVHVSEGAEVAAGDPLVTLESGAIDEQIAALKAQSSATQRQLELIGQEARTMGDLLNRQLASRTRVSALERQMAEIEKEHAGLNARIVLAEQELQRAVVRAPVAGRVMSLAVRGPGEVLAPGGVLAQIVPQDERLAVEGRLSPALIDMVRPGQPAKVWLTGLSWREAAPLRAKVAWVAPDSVEDRRTGVPYFLARIELEEPRTAIARRYRLHPGQRAEILVLTGERTLIDQLIDPIVRNFNRAFRV